jgi:hypothetical protein
VRRGEVWRYQPVVNRPGQSTQRLIVSLDAYNADERGSTVLALQIVDDDPGGLLAVRIGEFGWARALSVEPVTRGRLIECLGVADRTEIDAVSTALRAALDL